MRAHKSIQNSHVEDYLRINSRWSHPCFLVEDGLSTGDKGVLIARTLNQSTPHRRKTMTKLWAVLLVLASLLLVAPVLESNTSESSQIFQAVGNAEGGGGGA
jgi:hypothetical protein